MKRDAKVPVGTVVPAGSGISAPYTILPDAKIPGAIARRLPGNPERGKEPGRIIHELK